jgi:hypothetical protein
MFKRNEIGVAFRTIYTKTITSEIWGSQDGEDVDCDLQCYAAMQFTVKTKAIRILKVGKHFQDHAASRPER